MGTSERKPAILFVGGAKRLGASLCRSAALKGYAVAIHYNKSESSAKALVEELWLYGADCETFQGDLREDGSPQKLLNSVQQRFPNLVGIVYGASDYSQDHWSDASTDRFTKEFTLQGMGILQLARAWYHSGVEDAWFTTILDARLEAKVQKHFSYQLARRNAKDLTVLLAGELAPQIRVNALAPGLILPGEEDPAQWKRAVSALPLGRPGTPAEVAQGLWFLAENPYIVGQVLYVDGGRHLKERPYG
jgi:pteridine reductase